VFRQGVVDADDFAPSGQDKVYPPLYNITVQYWKALRTLQKTLYDITDRALGLDKGTMERYHVMSGTEILGLRYMDYFQLSPEKVSNKEIRCGGHTDFGTYTILKCDETPGLEVAVGEIGFDEKKLAPKQFDKWEKVCPRPGALVINSGDLLRFWTNGHWKSAFHRVVNTQQRRISVVYFTNPGGSARTDDRLPSKICTGPDNFPQVKMTMGEFFQRRSELSSVYY